MKHLRKLFVLIFTIFFSMHLLAQIEYENGYFINNQNVRVDCLIHNEDWKNNPKAFKYKVDDRSTPVDVGIDSVKEFRVNNYAKYIRAKVKIDRSADAIDLDAISNDPQPQWSEEVLFLKVQFEGEADLFSYEENNFLRFFYQLKNGTVEQLIYKPYKENESGFLYNAGFRNQLFIKMNCDNNTTEKFENIAYNEDELKQFFREYNKCKGGSTVFDSTKLMKRKLFNLKIIAGLNYSSLTTGYLGPPYNTIEFKPKINFIGGAEAEFILPYNKNKWSILVEPTYYSYQSTGKTGYAGNGEIDYKALAIAAGVRYYFFLNKDSRIFVDLVYAYNAEMSSTFHSYLSNLEISNNGGFNPGAGFAYKKFAAEFRYSSINFFDYDYFGGSFNTCSLTFKYQVL